MVRAAGAERPHHTSANRPPTHLLLLRICCTSVLAEQFGECPASVQSGPHIAASGGAVARRLAVGGQAAAAASWRIRREKVARDRASAPRRAVLQRNLDWRRAPLDRRQATYFVDCDTGRHNHVTEWPVGFAPPGPCAPAGVASPLVGCNRRVAC